MSLHPPREGSRDTGKGIIVSIYPDVCYAKDVPVPFSLYAIQEEDANTAPTVRMTGQRAHNARSITTCSHGDEPGVAGVKSGTIGSICEPKTWSKTVNIEGKPAVRHNDEWWMNNRNTIGKLCWVENTESNEPTPIIQVAQAATGTMTDASPTGGTFPLKKVGGQRRNMSLMAQIGNLLTGGMVATGQVECKRVGDPT